MPKNSGQLLQTATEMSLSVRGWGMVRSTRKSVSQWPLARRRLERLSPYCILVGLLLEFLLALPGLHGVPKGAVLGHGGSPTGQVARPRGCRWSRVRSDSRSVKGWWKLHPVGGGSFLAHVNKYTLDQ